MVKHRCFEVDAGPDARAIVHGDPNMSDESKAALTSIVGAAAKLLRDKPFKPCAHCAPEFERIAARLRELEAHFATLQEPAPVTTSTARVVHLLAEGRALCGLKGVPSEWPPGHVWVSFFSDERRLADCLGCTRAAR